MKQPLQLLAVIVGIIAIPAPAFAQSDAMVEIRGSKPFTLRADRAYFLFRSSSGISPVFLRVPSDTEVQAYEVAKREAFAKAKPRLSRTSGDLLAQEQVTQSGSSLQSFNFVWDGVRNAQTVNMGRSLDKTGNEKTLLVEALPGNYVLYGLGSGDIFLTCFCLGTVSFTGRPGMIADLGTLFVSPAATKSEVPELARETGFGPSMNGHLVTWAGAIRPVSASSSVSPRLAGLPIGPADYRATGKFVAGFSFSINRLAPIPGVLGYNRGDVLDLIANRIAPNQY